MFPRRSLTSPNPGYAPSHPKSGSSGSRRSSSLLVNQRAGRLTTVQTVETEFTQSETLSPQQESFSPQSEFFSPQSEYFSPQSETLPPQSETVSPDTQNAPPMPPRQSPLLPSHPGNDTLRPPQRDSHETLGSPVSPSNPMWPRLSVTGGSASGSAMPSSPLHGLSFGYSHQSTAGYTIMPSPQPGSGMPHHEPPDISGGIHADVWPIYNKISQNFDEKNLMKWNQDLDVLLIFAALFSAIVTSFLITALGDLSPDYQQQSALLLYQLLNGRDPSLTSASDPTAPFEPSSFAVAVNCLWLASLSASLGASFGAMVCKEWLTEYNGGASPVVDILRACQRQVRFMAFKNWNAYSFIALLPPLLHSSVLLFFAGAVIYLWQISLKVALVCLATGGIFGTTYFVLAVLPIVMDAPFHSYSTRLFRGLSFAIRTIIRLIAGALQRGSIFALDYVVYATLWPFVRCRLGNVPLHPSYTRTPPSPRSVKALSDSLEKVDTSQRTQEEAILWLSQMPLDPTESKAVVSSLALISCPHRFPKSVIEFLNSTLESTFPEASNQAYPELPINCLLALGHIKYQLAVDQHWDQDHSVGGIPVSPLVAWEAQKRATNALNETFTFPHFQLIRTRLLTAAAWLSPVIATQEVMPDGRELEIQDRGEFAEKFRATLTHYIGPDNPLVDHEVLINLIHGMHAYIPRGDYGIASSTVFFLPLICGNYESPWSENESVLRALITYALDLLLPPTRKKPLVEREIGFDKLASELIDTLLVGTTSTDVVAFGFWLVYRVLYAFRSRKSILADIVHIWASTNANEAIPQDNRQRVNFHAVHAFAAVTQYHPSAGRSLPKLAAHNTLNLLKAGLRDNGARPMAIYAVAMILSLGSSTQADCFRRGLDVESFTETLHPAGRDLEKNLAGEAIVEDRIYSALVLFKLQPPQIDVEGVKTLIEEMERTIEDTFARDSGSAREPVAGVNVDLDRMKWKVIYLCGLLLELLPPDERVGSIERVRGRVLSQSGGLVRASDYKDCVKPLGIGALEPRALGQAYSVFEAWTKGFPSLSLVGSIISVRK